MSLTMNSVMIFKGNIYRLTETNSKQTERKDSSDQREKTTFYVISNAL